MPLVRVDLPAGRPREYRQVVGDVIYDAMRATLDVPENDRFQIFSEHPAGDLVIDPGYLGIRRSGDCLVIQVFLNRGRSTAQKQGFYRAVADGLHSRLGLRREDVLINLVEVGREDWSFGDGEAQYV